MYQFTFAPAKPDMQQLRADAQRILEASAHEKRMAEAVHAPPVTAIHPGSIVRLLNSSPYCPMYVRVLKVYANDTLTVQSLCVSGVQWKVGIDEVVANVENGVA